MEAKKILSNLARYFTVGVLFSSMYCYLSGWSNTAFVTFIFVGPILVAGFLFALANEKIISISNNFSVEVIDPTKLFKKSSQRFPIVPWFYLLYLLLPIISYRLSYYFIEKKYEIDMWWLYSNRYLSLAYVLLGVLFILGLIALGLFIKGVLRGIKLKKKATAK